MSVYAEILEWSEELREWQRDALRRLVSSSVTDQDLDELEYLCLRPQGLSLPGYEHLTAQPLSRDHLPVSDDTVGDVSLAAIKAVRSVNLIAETSQLTFGDTGLTIIYGYNGSGKSGYTRILKRVCRARDGGSAICPNVFEEHDGTPAGATICFTSGGNPVEYAWTDGDTPLAGLGRVCIFDTTCAEFYATKENDVAYRPFGLDLFDRLAAVADRLNARLEERRVALKLQCLPPPMHLQDASELKGIYPVTAKTSQATLDAVASFTKHEQSELSALKRAVDEQNPIRKAAVLRGRKGLLSRATEKVKNVLAILNAAKTAEFRCHSVALQTAKEASRLVSEEAFKALLPGTGGVAWKSLWDQARKFAATAYPGATFPNVEEGDCCLLCQQPLLADAQQRLTDFEAFVRQETAINLAQTQRQVAADQDELRKLNLTAPEDDVLSELRSHQDEWAIGYATFKRDAATTVQALLEAFNTGEWDSISLPVFDTAPIDSAAQAFEREASLTLVSGSSEEVAKRAARLVTLEARKWIEENRVTLKGDIVRAKELAAVKSAIATTNTASISRKSTELTKTHVTDALRTAVENELQGINANHLRITLASRTLKGTAYHRIEIKGRKVEKIAVKDIVSEGEFRAIALAAFFAELSQSTDDSAIVVDDPVSSLDHLYREKVAVRFISEAKRRQVIVFTHDILFLRALIDEAERKEVNLTLRQLTRGDGQVGLVSADVPWDTQKVKARLGHLQRTLDDIKKHYADNQSVFEALGRDWYGHLREVWELTVEEIVLNGCIQRFKNSIHTTPLKKVVDFTSADYEAIERGMTRSSRWLRGHSKPIGDNTPFPTPDELEADLKEIKDFVVAMRRRR